ncbi:hypothetical protein Tco_1368140 [Tanacetum coccineum]
MDWGEVNPVHAYYNGSCTSKDNEDPSWSTSFKTRRTQKTSSALEVLWKTLFLLYLYMIGTLVTIRPSMLDRLECWPITKALATRMEVAELRMQMWTCGKTMLDMIPNGVYRVELEVEIIINKMREGRLRWYDSGCDLDQSERDTCTGGAVTGSAVSVRGQACMDPCQSLAIMRRLVECKKSITPLDPAISLDEDLKGRNCPSHLEAINGARISCI